MGIVCALHALSDQKIEMLINNPPLIWRVIAPDDPDIYIERVTRKNSVGFFKQLFGKKEPQKKVEIQEFKLESEEIDTDLDKSWHCIHYCLNESGDKGDPPLDFLIETGVGEYVGDEDVGYGPARAISSLIVQEIHHKLHNISIDELKKKYNPAKMKNMNIYLSDMCVKDGDEAFEYIAEYYSTTKDFISHCANKGLGSIVYYS